MHVKESIVITGISGRFPESQNVEEFKEALLKGIDIVTVDDRRYPPGTLNTPVRLGKIPEIDKFDASFFGIHPKQADFMDPRQRILIEAVYESIIDAGFNPQELRGTRTGVYAGIGAFTNSEQLREMKTNGYTNIGVSLALAANRVSYCFDFKGPSYSVESACSSSMFAFMNAINDMRSGVADNAIVCGAQINLHPHESSEYNKLNMLAPDGKCKVFSTLRDGYLRSEAIVSILLQKENCSRRIYATVLGAKTNSDGYKIEGITYPSTTMQYQLLQETYDEAGVDPADVAYVEAHGTGTPIGDIQELQSITNMFCTNRKKVLPIGAVKSNMGHAELASGFCSLSKVLIAMECGIIPANLHADPIDTKLPGIKDGKLKVITKNESWNGGIVGINSFGFGGANAHLILKSNPKEKPKSYYRPKHRLVQVSGRTEEAVLHFLREVEKNPDPEFLALVDEIHKMNVEGHNFRGYTILGDNPKREIARYTKDRPIWFIYAGMGCQWIGMGRDLMKIDVFRHTIKRCAAVLKPYNIDVEDILTSTSPSTFDNIMHSLVAITVAEIGLTDVLFSLGIRPDGIAGHSLGEVGCSYADGQSTVEQAALMAYARGYASTSIKLPPGLMAAVGLSKEKCQAMLPEDIFIACHNGKNSVTISGPEDSVKVFVDELSAQGIFAKLVSSSGIAFHSKYANDAAPTLFEFVKNVLKNPTPRSAKWITSSVPEFKKHENWASYNCAEYHLNNFCNQVYFNDVYKHIPKNAIVIEVAPHGLLQAILKRELSANNTSITLANRASDDNEEFLLSGIGKIFLAGGQPNLTNFYKGVVYPVGRGTQMLAPLVKWDHSTTWCVPYWKNKDSFGAIETVNLSDKKYAYLAGHNIDGRVLMPATGYLEFVWRVLAQTHLQNIENFPVVMKNIKFQRETVLSPNDDVKFLINIMKQSGNFEITEGDSIVATGKICSPKDVANEFSQPECPITPKDDYLRLRTEDLYKECHLRRYMYEGHFRGIEECDVHGLKGKVEWKGEFTSFLDTMLHLNIITDTGRNLQLPTSIDKLVIDPREHLKQVSKDKVLPIFYNQTLNVVKSGAVEIIGSQSSKADRRQKIQTDPVLEKYVFVPYEMSARNKVDLERWLQIATQIILQNLTGLIKRMKVCEVSQNNEGKFLGKIMDILSGQAMVEAEYEKYNSKNKNARYDLLIVTAEQTDLLNIDKIQDSLSDTGFVMYVGDIFKFVPVNLQIVCQAVTNDNHVVYLLRPNFQFPKKYAVVNVRNTDFDWLKKIKELVESRKDEMIYLFSQGEEVSGILGLVKCLLTEPGGTQFRSIFIQDETVDIFSVDDEFYEEQLTKNLTINVFKNGMWGSFVHLPFTSVESKEVGHAAIGILTPGDLSTLKWEERPSIYLKSDSNSELVYVVYSVLNFKDVMIATGKLSANQSMGFEYSGVTANGRRLMGFSTHEALSLQVQSDPDFTWEVPESWSLDEAATVPYVYATCYYAMIIRGQVMPGESILIHAGSGGIGVAAISIALSMGCIVYTTVGSQEKRDYLKQLFPQLKEENIGHSRNDSFKTMIMQRTNRRGVDVVLNSLSAELLQESLQCIAVRGRFLEIRKEDFLNGSPIDSKMFLKNCSFHSVFLDDLMEDSYRDKQKIKQLLDEGIKNGVVRPLTRTIFEDTEVEKAFRYLSSGNHKGKVLIRIRKEDSTSLKSQLKCITAIPKMYFCPKKSYIFIGGLGGFGLELADWLIRRGATKIILNSRKGVRNGYQSYCLKRWSHIKGVTVKINTDDSTNLEGAKKLVAEAQELGPVGGVFNMALILKDALIQYQTKEMFEAVFKTKIISGQNMDKVTREVSPELDHFVVFSSVACGRGLSGQTNYGMANSALERLCEKRKKDGLPGLAVQWGPIGDVGALAKVEIQDKIFDQMLAQNIGSCIDSLEKFMLQTDAVGSSIVLADKKSTSSTEASKNPSESVAHILGIRNIDLIDKTITLSRLGLDSLMLAEIEQSLYKHFQLKLSANDIRDLTFNKLFEMGGSDEAKPAGFSNGVSADNHKTPNGIISKETIIELNSNENSKKTVFFIHSIEGQVEVFRAIARQLKAVVYGLQCTNDADYDNLQDYAKHFIKQMKNKQPSGPYFLCGYSYGGALALEMGLQLEQYGEKVNIVSIDGSPDYIKNTLKDGFVKNGKSVNKLKAVILSSFSSAFNKLNVEKVEELLTNTVDWEKQLQVISDQISKETGLNAGDIALSADRYYKRCRAGYYYEPQNTLKAKILLIRREDNQFLLSDDYELQKICKQKVEVLKLKGDHKTILAGENSKTISAKINEILTQ